MFFILYLNVKRRGGNKRGNILYTHRAKKKGRNKRKVIEMYGKEIIQKIFFIKD